MTTVALTLYPPRQAGPDRPARPARSGSRRVSRRDPVPVCRTSIVPPWSSGGTGCYR